MRYRFVKRYEAIGWDWYLESDDCSSWVSPLAKEVIEKLEAENAKMRELLQRTWDAFHDATAREFVTVKNDLRELGVEVEA